MAGTDFLSTLLPRPLQDGYGLTASPVVIRTEMDAGMPRVRRRFTRGLTTAQLCWNFTRTEMAVFDGWWRNILLDGSQWFDIPLRNGASDTTWTCRSLAIPQATLIQFDTWKVVWQVEVDGIPAFDQTDIDAILAGDASDLSAEDGQSLEAEDGTHLQVES